jgi:hypothetical protein
VGGWLAKLVFYVLRAVVSDKIERLPKYNFRRGLHSYLGTGAKTSLGVCLTEHEH